MSVEKNVVECRATTSTGQVVYSRRSLLKRAALVSVVGIGVMSGIACSGESSKPSTADNGQAPADAQPVIAGQSSCEEAELSPQQMGARRVLAYVDQSPDPARICSGCQLFKAPLAGATCGGCQAVAGPIAPGGHCSAWVARA